MDHHEMCPRLLLATPPEATLESLLARAFFLFIHTRMRPV